MFTIRSLAIIVTLAVLGAPAAVHDVLRKRMPERDEAGMTTEAVIITALLAALAIAALAIITTKVLSRANSINL